jgi:hypothetical protein
VPPEGVADLLAGTVPGANCIDGITENLIYTYNNDYGYFSVTDINKIVQYCHVLVFVSYTLLDRLVGEIDI